MATSLSNAGRRLTGRKWGLLLGALEWGTAVGESPVQERFRPMEQAISVIGLEVRGSKDETLGRVTDLALDLEHGRLVEVIVTSSGGWGLNDRTVAVPPAAFRFDPSLGLLRLDLDQKQYKAAPDFELSRWAEHRRSRRVAEVYRYHGQEPWFADDGYAATSGHPAREPLGHVERSSRLIGLPVMSRRGEPLGNVNVFLYNLLAGRVLHVIVIAPGVSPGHRGTPSRYRGRTSAGAGLVQIRRVIPAEALRFNETHDALFFDVSAEAFRNEPRFQWAAADYEDHQQRLYEDFRQETYLNAPVAAQEGFHTRQDVSDGSASAHARLTQGGSFADRGITRQIYAAIRADASLARMMQNVEVSTLNRRITLRGHVHSTEARRALGSIAATVGRPENVSNLLEVKPMP